MFTKEKTCKWERLFFFDWTAYEENYTNFSGNFLFTGSLLNAESIIPGKIPGAEIGKNIDYRTYFLAQKRSDRKRGAKK